MVETTAWWRPQRGGDHSVVETTAWWRPQRGGDHSVVETTAWWRPQRGGGLGSGVGHVLVLAPFRPCAHAPSAQGGLLCRIALRACGRCGRWRYGGSLTSAAKLCQLFIPRWWDNQPFQAVQWHGCTTEELSAKVGYAAQGKGLQIRRLRVFLAAVHTSWNQLWFFHRMRRTPDSACG